MAVYKLFPSKDATLYSEYPSMNTGIDEILEMSTITAVNGTTPQTSRAIIQFDSTEMNNIKDNFIGTASFAVDLKLNMAKVEGLNHDVGLDVFSLALPWNNGTGKYLDDPQTTNGASWKFTTTSGSTEWVGNIPTGATSSYTGSNAGGGCWWTGSTDGYALSASATLGYRDADLDLNFNVTDIFTAWFTSSINNYGFIVKQSSSLEFLTDSAYRTELKYFSVDTNTIYPPELIIKWDDSDYDPGTAVSTSEVTISLRNNVGTYYSGSVQRFRVDARPQYPTRVFTTSSLNTTNYSLPEASYYSIRDLDTNEVVIPFDNTYTKLSADSNGSYFDLYMAGLEPERYYKVQIKTTLDNSTLILDDNYYFKVVNG